MRRARLRAVVLSVAMVGAGVVASAPPAVAAPRVNVCSMTGVLAINPGSDGTSVVSPYPGRYYVYGAALVCGGVNVTSPLGAQVSTTGTANFASAGDTGMACSTPHIADVVGNPLPGFSQLCGTWSTSAFSLSNDACAGGIGGPGVWNSNPLGGAWSLVAGNTISGSIGCNGNPIGNFALVATPMAPSFSCSPPPFAGPVWFCEWFFTGVAVFAT